MNNKRLKAIKGEEYVVKAICLHKTIKGFDPPEEKAGEVNKTSFQKELKIKIGAKVMLTYNVDTGAELRIVAITASTLEEQGRGN